MRDKYYETKKRWNASNYKQLNVSLNPQVYEIFQATCKQQGKSMRQIIVEFINSYTAIIPTPNKPKLNELATRGNRRKALKSVANQLVEIRDAEEQYLENMPENLKNSSRYFATEQSIELIGEIIDLLGEVFS